MKTSVPMGGFAAKNRSRASAREHLDAVAPPIRDVDRIRWTAAALH